MDAHVKAVLDDYHAQMQQEHDTWHKVARAGVMETLRDNFMLAIGPDSGRLINILARSLDRPHILELGTSYGYSTLWLAEAARAAGGRVTTIELQAYKSTYARDMSAKAGLADYVDFRVGDALETIDDLPHGIDFVLVDLWKDLYTPCLERFYPKLNPGAIVVADNIIMPGTEGVLSYVKAIRAKPDVSSILVPVGSGLEISSFGPA